MQTTPLVHSKLGASSYDRWGACPGSVAASEGIEKTTSVFAEEGTLAHDVGAKILLGDTGVECDEEMLEAVNIYVDYIEKLRYEMPDFEAVEQRLSLAAYHPALFGTADYVAYFAHTKTLHVVDYKHGRGIPVGVVGSKQLMYYGLGALHENKFPIEKVVLTIVQPRCYHPDGPIRSWETDPITMLDFAAQLIEDAKKTEMKDAPLNPGEHCRFCPAQPTCKAIEEKALANAQDSFSNVEKYDPDKLAQTLNLIPQIEAWCKSVREFAYQQASLGNCPPGFKLVDKRATRKWKEGFAPIGEEWYDRKLKSPAQMEKILPKDRKASIEPFTIKESSGKSLVSANDDREPVMGAIEAMFI